MCQTALQLRESANDTREKWFRSPVSFHKGNLTQISAHIPTFERRSFGLIQSGNEVTRLNEHLDTICQDALWR
jgi:hypothetical protein